MGYVQEARENHVKKKVEEALRSKMKQKALKECDHYTSKYAECAMGRTLSVVWHCRKEAKELNQCLKQYTNDSVLEEMKKSYMLEQDSKGAGSLKTGVCLYKETCTFPGYNSLIRARVLPLIKSSWHGLELLVSAMALIMKADSYNTCAMLFVMVKSFWTI